MRDYIGTPLHATMKACRLHLVSTLLNDQYGSVTNHSAALLMQAMAYPSLAHIVVGGPEYLLTEDLKRLNGMLHEVTATALGPIILDASWDLRRAEDPIPPP